MYKWFTFSTFSIVYKSSQTCIFLHVHFYATFSFARDSKSASNSAFFGTHIENIWKKDFFSHISTFCNLLSQTHTQLCLRIHFFIDLWVRTFNFLKKVYIVVAQCTRTLELSETILLSPNAVKRFRLFHHSTNQAFFPSALSSNKAGRTLVRPSAFAISLCGHSQLSSQLVP